MSDQQLVLALLALGLLGPVFMLLLAFMLIARASRGRPQISADRRISWYGELTPSSPGPSGAQQPACLGRVSLDSTHLYWDPETGARWAAPIAAITVLRRSTGWMLGRPYLDLVIDGSGEWRLVVSDKPVNHLWTNDIRRIRAAGRTGEFADRLVAGGARSSPVQPA